MLTGLLLSSCTMGDDTGSGATMSGGIMESTGEEMMSTPVELTRDQAEALIRLYYQDIASGDLQGAFAMRGDSMVDLATFQNWYQWVTKSTVDQLTALSNHLFTFRVTLEETNEALPTHYIVTMDVSKGKLYTINSKKIEENGATETMEEGQDPVEMIYNYYGLISSGRLTAAYAMRSVDAVPPSLFKEWYGNVAHAFIRDMKIAGGDYEFRVELIHNDNTREEYNVKMAVAGGKLKTIYSNKVESEVGNTINAHGLEAYVKWEDKDGGTFTLFTKKQGGEEHVADVVFYGKGELGFFPEIQPDFFTEDGRYLVYNISDVEWHQTKVYDMQEGRVVHASNIPPELFGFTNGSEYYYECNPTGFFEGSFHVYATSDFSEKASFAEEPIHTCMNYNPENNKMALSVGADEAHLREWVYDFAAGSGDYR